MTQIRAVSAFFSNLMLDNLDERSSIRQGLQRLLLLRSFVAASGLVIFLLFQALSNLQGPVAFILSIVMAIFASVIFGIWRLRAASVISNAEVFGHLLFDVFFLVLLLVNTGGASNPLISYLLVLLAVTATLLPKPYVNSFAISGIAIYTFFIFLDFQVEHQQNMEGQEMSFQLHLVGMWVIFVVSAILISVFITRMASTIKVREATLAKSRENEIRNEQLVAIGTLAAGTAHALGTPLSTMAVLLTELDRSHVNDLNINDVKEDISLLKQQVTRCKNSLAELTRYYNKDSSESNLPVLLSVFSAEIMDYIINIHPTSKIDFDTACAPDIKVASDLSLKHAIINIIENSIKAANNKVLVKFSTSESITDQLEIAITDDGPGIPAEVLEKVGEPFISMRKESMGIGIFLANAAVQKLNGTIELFNLKQGGAKTLIKLPLPTSMAT
ncbi:MAG: two-component system sensor histidine kinase RegB [Pseudohongiellaceae bacterium]|jgi:two-component system sensor histidine kinase RegB